MINIHKFILCYPVVTVVTAFLLTPIIDRHSADDTASSTVKSHCSTQERGSNVSIDVTEPRPEPRHHH